MNSYNNIQSNVQNKTVLLTDGSGHGTSVLGMLKAFEDASGKPVPFEFLPRRADDVASYHADVSLAYTLLGWRASLTIDDRCRDAWDWQQRNPEGYRTEPVNH